MEGALARQDSLLSAIAARPGVTAKMLAGQFSVAIRTIRRDVGQLRDRGHRIEASPGPGGGYRVLHQLTMSTLLLNDDEVLATATGLRSPIGVPGLDAASASAGAKLATIVPERLRLRLRALEKIQRIDDPRRAVDAAVLVTLALACSLGEAVRLTRTAQEHARTVQPYRLVHAAHAWYLVAHERDTQEWRTWALDRITRAEPLAARLPTPPPPGDAAEFVLRTLALGRHIPVHLRALQPVDRARATVSATIAQVDGDEHESHIRLATDDLAAAARWVAFLGFDVEVIEPDDLRKHLVNLGRHLIAQYDT